MVTALSGGEGRKRWDPFLLDSPPSRELQRAPCRRGVQLRQRNLQAEVLAYKDGFRTLQQSNENALFRPGGPCAHAPPHTGSFGFENPVPLKRIDLEVRFELVAGAAPASNWTSPPPATSGRAASVAASPRRSAPGRIPGSSRDRRSSRGLSRAPTRAPRSCGQCNLGGVHVRPPRRCP